MDAFFVCSYLTIVHKALSAGVITDGPITQVVLLGQYAEFQCRTAMSGPQWIIDGTILEPALENRYQEQRGIRITSHNQMGNADFVSVLEVHALEINNNTAIQCAVFSGDALSDPALLKIQGLLAAPPDLTATALNFSTVHVTWSPPFTLDVSGSAESSILGYSILVKNGSGDTVMEANSTLNEFHYTVEEDNECQLAAYQVCVAGINGLGIGLHSQPIPVALGFVVLTGPKIAKINTASQFSCQAFCHESLLVTWIINGSVLSYFRSSVIRRTDHTIPCSSNNIDVFADSLDPFTVQCAALYACLQFGNDVTDCRPKVYYSHIVQVTVNESLPNSDGTTTNGITDEGRKTQLIGIELTIGTAAGITVFFCIILILVLCVFICREVKKDREGVPDTSNDVIYEQCGDPVPARDLQQADASPEMVVYDSVTQSQLVDTKPCVAYGSARPIMEPCIAYAARSEV